MKLLLHRICTLDVSEDFLKHGRSGHPLYSGADNRERDGPVWSVNQNLTLEISTGKMTRAPYFEPSVYRAFAAIAQVWGFIGGKHILAQRLTCLTRSARYCTSWLNTSRSLVSEPEPDYRNCYGLNVTRSIFRTFCLPCSSTYSTIAQVCGHHRWKTYFDAAR